MKILDKINQYITIITASLWLVGAAVVTMYF